MVAATAGSAVVTLGQLRSLQAGFDRLTEVYVQFNHHLASAHVQAVRIGEQVRTHQGDVGSDRGAPVVPEVDDAFLATFGLGLENRNAEIAAARAPVDDALADPSRFGGQGQLQQLEEIRALLDELESLARLDAMVDPADVLEDERTQGQIERLFKQLAAKSSTAIDQLRGAYQDTQVLVQWLTLGLTLGITVVGVLAAAGVVLTLRPLRRLSESVRNLGRGDWSQRVDPTVTDREDEVGHLAAEFNDMAGALEERERRLLRGERLAAAGQLAAQITHEIRNPLSSVALNAELLEDELSGDASEARELLGKISTEVERLTAVTEGYLRFARRPKPEESRIDLVRELDNLLDFMGHELESAGIEVVTDFPSTPVTVSADPSQLRQAFMNLLRNAQEALIGEAPGEGTADPRLVLSVRCKDNLVHAVVQDNGPGIDLPEEKLDTIFEAFFTRKARGTGLGLPTVQQILQDHGGGVRVAETGPSGTIFEVSLPACRPETASVSSDSSAG
ncbi:MAG: HAMP domain-containing sensor histidine kinase [Myxococcota bacterium]